MISRPRREAPACGCGSSPVDEMPQPSEDDAESGVSEDEFRARPGKRLLELIERRGLNYADVAIALDMASPPKNWVPRQNRRTQADEYRERCRVAMRAYTHGSKRAGAGMVVRWATYFGVDPAYFYSDGTRPLADFDLLSKE